MRFVAVSCVWSAWLTLILFGIMGLLSIMAGAGFSHNAAVASRATNYFPSTPVPNGPSATGLPATPFNPTGSLGNDPDSGLLGGASPLPGPGLGLATLSQWFGPICYVSGVLSLASAVGGFLLFLGIAQACYALLELEEQNYQMNQALQVVIARLGQIR